MADESADEPSIETHFIIASSHAFEHFIDSLKSE
jgi:hypothetical protein